jgi:serine/threonine-protein kinase
MAGTALVLAPDDTLGGYRILEVIGIGGMAVVYRAEQVSLGREVALKVLAPGVADDDTFRERFRREGRHVGTLDHPHVVTVYDSGEADGQLFLAMRLVRGSTLAERIRLGGLTAPETLVLLSPIADALDAAHAAGLVHRDIKPQNILIDSTGRSYLADFGVAKGMLSTDDGMTRGFVGTYNYAAPEQIRGGSVTAATDIYALTAVLYQCLTGRLPYARDTNRRVLQAHMSAPPPALDGDDPYVRAVNRMIATGMAKQPNRRFASAGELIEAAARAIDLLPTSRETFALSSSASPVVGDPVVDGHEYVARPSTSARADSSTEARSSARPREDATNGTDPHSRGRVRWVAVPAALVLAGIGAGAVVLAGGGASARERFTASAAPFTVKYARPWRATNAAVIGATALLGGPGATRPAGAGSTNSIRLSDGRATLAAGSLVRSAPVPGGVPPTLVADYGHGYTSADTRIAGHPARVYTWSRPNGWLAAYVLPGAGGDGAIICSAPTAAAPRSCPLMAQGAIAPAEAVLPPGPDRQLAQALAEPLAGAIAARTQLGALDRGTPRSRAATAAALARADAQASTEILRLAAPERYRRELTQLSTALKGESHAFEALAAAARADDRRAYARAQTRVTASSQALTSAAAVLAPALLGVPRFVVVRPPALPRARRTQPPPSTSAGSSGAASTSASASTGTGSAAPLPSGGGPSGTGSGGGTTFSTGFH